MRPSVPFHTYGFAFATSSVSCMFKYCGPLFSLPFGSLKTLIKFEECPSRASSDIIAIKFHIDDFRFSMSCQIAIVTTHSLSILYGVLPVFVSFYDVVFRIPLDGISVVI